MPGTEETEGLERKDSGPPYGLPGARPQVSDRKADDTPRKLTLERKVFHAPVAEPSSLSIAFTRPWAPLEG